jgi:hypothetical protein
MAMRKDRIHPGMRDREESVHTILSERDNILVLSLFENAPAPTPKLRAAIAAMPRTRRRRDEPAQLCLNCQGDPNGNV